MSRVALWCLPITLLGGPGAMVVMSSPWRAPRTTVPAAREWRGDGREAI